MIQLEDSNIYIISYESVMADSRYTIKRERERVDERGREWDDCRAFD